MTWIESALNWNIVSIRRSSIMSPAIRLLWAAAVATALFAGVSSAQELPFRRYTIEDGLVNNEVLAGFQDSLGYIWFGTYMGLSRFDGKAFVNYVESPDGLGGSTVRDITEDVRGAIWAGYVGGFARIDQNGVKNYSGKDGLLGSDVISLWPDEQKGLWILTDLGVSYFDENGFETYPLDGVNAGSFSSMLTGSAKGDIFVVSKYGLFHKPSEKNEFEHRFQVSHQIKAIHYHQPSEALYLMSARKLYSYKGARLSFVAESPLEDPLINFTMSGNNRIRLHSETELWEIALSGDIVFTNQMLNEFTIANVLEDREENLWIMTRSGVAILLSSKIVNFSRLPLGVVTSIVKDDENALWIAGDKGAVKLARYGKVLQYIESAFVEDMLIDENKLYLCPSYSFLPVYNRQGELLAEFDRDYHYTCILKDAAGKLWVGSYNGLYSIQKNRLTPEIDTSTGLRSNRIWALLEDASGVVWAGTEKGLSAYDGSNWKHYGKEDGLSHESIWRLYEDEKLGLLAGTTMGVSRFKKSQDAFDTLPYLSDQMITNIGRDHRDNLWAGTGKGIYRINPEGEITLFLNKAKGLPSDSTYPKSMLIDPPYLYAGAHKGLSRIELDMDMDESTDPRLYITKIMVNNTPVDFNASPMILGHNQNNLVFHFTGIHFRSPEGVSYVAKLEGAGVTWSDRGRYRKAGYTNLYPGEYVFTVQAFADSGGQSEKRIARFIIEKPVWRTFGFYVFEAVAVVLLIIAASFLINRRRLKQSEKYAGILKKQVEERTLELIEKNVSLNTALKEVELANRQIVGSIQYAEKIQSSLLPVEETFESYFSDYFIIYKPRDIVGGDIFLLERVSNGFLITVIDCTGHGVPGAFMTMIAVTVFKRIVLQDRNADPANILRQLNFIVKKSLKQDTSYSHSDDGLDAGICFIDPTANRMIYAGARISLRCVRNNRMKLINGDKQSIGYRRSNLDYHFTNHTIDDIRDTSFYMASDGYSDQLGGERGISFGKSNFEALICRIADLPFDSQRKILLEEFKKYKGDYERQDDITIVGFRI